MDSVAINMRPLNHHGIPKMNPMAAPSTDESPTLRNFQYSPSAHASSLHFRTFTNTAFHGNRLASDSQETMMLDEGQLQQLRRLRHEYRARRTVRR